METVRTQSMGWVRDYPDIRDFTPLTKHIPESSKKRGVEHTVSDMLSQLGFGAKGRRASSLPSSIDLREWCSPVEDQGKIGSCTAHAVVGLLEYYERKAFGTHIDASRLFLYKATRNLLQWEGDQGGLLRSAIGALALFGVPPEEYWKYDEASFDEEPTAFCYSFASNYKALSYYRLDPPKTDTAALLDTIKSHLAKQLPLVFGFTVYNTMGEAQKTGGIPFPSKGDKVSGGHAVMAVGYDDKKKITGKSKGAKPTTGAILIRNSWGEDWGGNGGYLWLPYEYILEGLADDWWALIKNAWIETKEFGQK